MANAAGPPAERGSGSATANRFFQSSGALPHHRIGMRPKMRENFRVQGPGRLRMPRQSVRGGRDNLVMIIQKQRLEYASGTGTPRQRAQQAGQPGAENRSPLAIERRRARPKRFPP